MFNKYINLRVANREVRPKELVVTETFENAVVPASDIANYQLTVTRFTINLSSLPIMFFPRAVSSDVNVNTQNPSKGSPDNTRFYVTMRKSGVDISRPVQFRPQSTGVNIGDQGYLAVRSFQHFIDMINKTMYDAAQAFVPTIDAPYFVLDRSQNRVILYAAESEYAQGVGATELYFNASLYRYFRGLNAEYIYDNTYSINKAYKILIRQQGANNQRENVVTPYRDPYSNNLVSTAGIHLLSYTEPQMLGNWISIKNVVFTTSLPVVAEVYNSFVTDLNGGNKQNDMNVLVDFEIIREGNDSINLQGVHTYNVSSEFRMVSLVNTSDIHTLNLQIFFQDKYGYRAPVMLDQDDYFSVKLLFREKPTLDF